MKLGILVVYLVNQGESALLALHLSALEKYTEVPYTIYGAAPRLRPEFKQQLQGKVHLPEIPKPANPLVGSEEHSYYLKCLTESAIADGCQVLAIFHVDSFPVQAWFKKLSFKLLDYPLIAASRRIELKDSKPHTCFMLFTSEFYQKYQPSLLLSPEQLQTPTYQEYQAQNPHLRESGFGFAYTLYCQQLPWLPLLKTNAKEPHSMLASIYDDTFFHLGAAAQRYHIDEKGNISPNLVPVRTQETLSESTKRELLQAPEQYLNWLRGRGQP